VRAPNKEGILERLNMAKRKRGGRRKKTVGIVTSIADANLAIQFAEPFVPAIQQALSGDVKGGLASFRAAAKEALQMKNVGEALAPSVGVRAVRKLAGFLGFRNSTLGRSRFKPL
jgi:hypothetical protein